MVSLIKKPKKAEISRNSYFKKKSAVLFSGGKDSCLALEYAMKTSDVQCLIIMCSKNDESYMFHTPNIQYAKLQAKAIGLPLIYHETLGEKEEELKDLEKAVKIAIKKYNINMLVSGAIASNYQFSRIEKITKDLQIECYNPLWGRDQLSILNEIVTRKYEVIIIGAFGEGISNLIGRKIDTNFIEEIKKIQSRYYINPAGEGGEFESFVLYAPYWKKKIQIEESKMIKDKHGGVLLVISKASLTQHH